jgi:hypothetical protein
MTSWSVAFLATRASDGSPLSGIAVVEATPQARQLATTDATGAATVTFDIDASQRNALYMATTRFSIQHTDQRNIVTVYDQDLYRRITTGQPPYPEGLPQWKVKYTITDSSSGSPITGIPAIDPLTGVVLASNPDVTMWVLGDATEADFFAMGDVVADPSYTFHP